MIDINNKWALITGASRGVGMRVAKGLAEKGAKVILHSRKTDGTKTLADSINKANGTAISIAGELSKNEDVISIISKVREITNDNLEILYNNAGIMTAYLPKYTVPAEDYIKSFAVNTIAPAMLCDAFIPTMIKNGWGRIVNVTSGIANEPELMAYSCSKAALDRYVRDMLPTLENTGVIMNLVDPGWLRTDLGGNAAPNDPDSVLPGAIIPILLDNDSQSGTIYHAQDYHN